MGAPEVKYIYGLTPLQEGMLFHKIMSEHSSEYHNQDSVWIDEDINLEQFKLALKLLIFKHEALGAAFVIPTTTGVPRQIFFNERNIECDYEVTDTDDCDNFIEELRRRDLDRGFDLQRDCLIRVVIVKFKAINRFFVLVSHHHIIMDGWCMSIVFSDLMRYYKMLGELSYEAVEEIAQKEKNRSSKYIEYLDWLKKANRKEGLEYWKSLLDGYEENADIPPMSNGAKLESGVKEKTILFDKKHYDLIKDAAAKLNVTVNTVFETAWGILLQKYNYLDDVVFGKVVSGRNVPINGIEETVGLFINTIPCRITSDSDKKVVDLIREVQEQAARSSTYDFCPLIEIQKCTPQRVDLIKTLINFEYGDNYQNLQINQVSTREETNYAISVSFYLKNDQVLVRLIYDSGKYTDDEIDRLLNYLNNVVTAMVSNFDEKISNLSLLEKKDQEMIIREFNDSGVDVPAKTVSLLFEDIVDRFADKTAVAFGNDSITYSELNRRANCIARKLRELGAGPDKLVVIIAQKSIEMICGMIAIVKAGSAYVPIDPSYSKDRIKFMIKDSEPVAIISFKADVSDIADGIPIIDLAEHDTMEGNGSNLEHIDNPNDLIYCIYTSGTTGQPKGVLIENHSVVNLVKNCNYVTLDENTVILQTAQLSFDASTFEVWAPMLNGGTLHLINKDEMLDSLKFKRYIVDNKINLVFITTALFNQFLNEDRTIFNSIQSLIFGGELASENHIGILLEQDTGMYLMNAYGPTETTTYATYYPIYSKLDKTPIGKPISNTQIYICNSDTLCGIGVPGEICIAGAGLARGYLNRPELTSQRFVSNPFGNGKMYKTGDLGKWLPDGNIEYIGRIDEQVKIRGFRIELGEIESRMREVSGIKDCAVISTVDKSGDKTICAYYTSDIDIDESYIKDELKKNLPDYMIPSYMMILDSIPLNRNGKVDKRSLPIIETSADRDFVAPRNEIEEALCNVFREVLNVDRVGVKDSFFDLGGDSIKAIRVVSKMRAYSYDVSVRDIMQRHVIEDIASATRSSSNEYYQGEITGEIINTPVIRRFFNANLAEPSHYNQSIVLEVPQVNTSIVTKVLDSITKHHDILRAVCEGNKLVIRSFDENKGYDLCYYDLTGESDYLSKFESECNMLQSTINLSNGPLMRTALFKTSERMLLFITIHHLIVDAISWRILAEDISIAFDQISNGKPVVLPPKTASFKEWSETLKEYSNSEDVISEMPYWMNILNQKWPISYEKNKPETVVPKIEYIRTSLGCELTKSLIKEANRLYHTEPRDILIAALVMALGRVSDEENIVIGLEGHGREELNKRITVDRTVGWFTSIYPMLFKYSNSIDDILISVKDDLRTMPNNGLGYGLLSDKLGMVDIPVLFNYLGELDNEKHDRGGFVEIPCGVNVAPTNVLFKLAIDASITNRDLVIELAYDSSTYSVSTTQEILKAFVDSLSSVISYCISSNRSIKTRSDFTGNWISQYDLNQIFNIIDPNEISDIYPLVPLQEGMFFHYLVDKTTTNYVVQTEFALKRDIDADNMKTALDLLTRRYDVLRTRFIAKGISSPVQVVLNNRKAGFAFEDLSNFDEECLERIKTEDVERGFDPENDPLLRITLIKLGESDYHLLFTIHHMISDGWSLSMLFMTLFENYSKLELGVSVEDLLSEIEKERAETGEYSDYVKWIYKKDIKKAIDYWADLLDGYEQVAVIEPEEIPPETTLQMQKYEMSIDVETSVQIHDYSNRNHVTPNSVIEMVWGQILCAYNFTDDVVFGKVISGREADIDSVESIVGLFINSIPVRYSCRDQKDISELVKMIQVQSNESSKFSYCSLTDIQDKTVLGANLIKTLLVFENYYVDYNKMEDGRQQGYLPDIVSDREQHNYPISLIVSEEKGTMIFKCMYDPHLYVSSEIKRLLEHVCYVLKQVVSGGVLKVTDLSTLTENDAEKVLSEFNLETINHTCDEIPIRLIEEKVSEIPDEIALVFHDKKYTYREIDHEASILASKMKQIGIYPDDRIMLITESGKEMFIGILAILKTGAAFVPVNPKYPRDRIEMMIEDSNPKMILKATFSSEYDCSDIPVINLLDPSLYEGEIDPNLNNEAKPNNLAYILYTSGSTGKPKGVMIENASLSNFMKLMPKAFPDDVFSQGKRIASITNYTFDIFITESLTALSNGLMIILADEVEKVSSKELAALCTNNDVEILQITSSRIRAFLSDPISHQAFAGFKYIILAGEKVIWDTVEAISSISNARVYDAYGPTEATVFISINELNIHGRFRHVSIGKAFPNIKTYVIANEKQCGIGIPGELCIAGKCLARGYLNRPDITDEKFVQNSFGEGKMYRTGDIVCLREDGEIVYIDRVDDQVKIRGLRIELGEIQSVCREIEAVKDCAVTIMNKENEPVICAYLVSDTTISITAVIDYLSSKLPYYMVPEYITQINEIPVNSSGKLDKRSLPFDIAKAPTEYVEPRNEKERILCHAVEEVLGCNKVGINGNFFDLGGNSLKAIRLVSKLAEKQYVVSLQDVMRRPELEHLSYVMRLASSSSEASAITKFFTNSIQEFAKSGDQKIQNELLTEILYNLNQEINRYDLDICNSNSFSDHLLDPIQKFSYKIGVRVFAMQIPVCEEIDVVRMNRAWNKMLQTYDVLASSIIAKESKIRLYEAIISEIPYIDASNLDEYHKKELTNALFSFVGSYANDFYYDDIHSSVIPVCIKFDDDKYCIFIAGSHLVCDAFSFAVIEDKLFEYYYEDVDVEDRYSFTDNVDIIRNSAATASEAEIEKHLDLSRFNDTALRFQEFYENHKINKGYYQTKEDVRFSRLNSEKKLEIARRLFADMLHHAFGNTAIPIGMLRLARKTKNRNMFQYVGEYLDIVPVILDSEIVDEIEILASDKQRFMEEHNIFYAGLTHEYEDDSKGKMLIYNNVGALAGTDRIKHTENFNDNPDILECGTEDGWISFSIVFEEGKEEEMRRFLDNRFEDFLKD